MPKKIRTPSQSTQPKENIVGDNIRFLVKQQGKNLKGLARALEISPKTVYFWVQGYNNPDSTSRRKLCDYFGITESQLFSKGLPFGMQAPAKGITSQDLITKLAVEGVTADEVDRLSEKDRGLVRDLIKRLTTERNQQAREVSAMKVAPAKRKFILIVDDEARYIQPMQLKLKEIGYDVKLAANGIEGLAQMEERTPDLIIVDLMMSGMNGSEFLRELHKKGLDQKTKVMISSAYPHEIDSVYAENLSIEGYIEKPCSVEFLLKQIEEVIGGPT